MHWANLSAADCCFGLRFPLKAPGGSRSLHASTAFVHTAGLTSIPKMNSPFAFGSGKWGTPCRRMHSANFTALSRSVAFLSSPVPALLAVPVLLAVAVSEGACEPQPALIRLISATSARAANGRRFLLMFTAASLDRA
jgi:hypothetical protein